MYLTIKYNIDQLPDGMPQAVLHVVKEKAIVEHLGFSRAAIQIRIFMEDQPNAELRAR